MPKASKKYRVHSRYSINIKRSLNQKKTFVGSMLQISNNILKISSEVILSLLRIIVVLIISC